MRDNSGFQIQEQAPRFYESKVSLFMAPFVQSVVQAAVGQGDRVLDAASGTGFTIESPALRYLCSKSPDLRLHFKNCLEVNVHGKQLAPNELTCGALVSDG